MDVGPEYIVGTLYNYIFFTKNGGSLVYED